MDSKLSGLLQVINAHFRDATVYLFGSRARRVHRPDSDYDLIVISVDFKDTPFVDRAAGIWKHAAHGFAADLLCYTPKEFEQASKTSVVLQDAMRHAVRL